MNQKTALDILKMGHNVLLTGPAGSGKTYLLNKFIKFLSENGVNHAITASTGIAATHMAGFTIHSWSGIGIRENIDSAGIKNLLKKYYLKKNILKTKVLIIDEISMLHDYQLDLIDKVIRAFKKSIRPFGGMQVVFSGDFFQLPPVKRGARENRINFILNSGVFSKLNIKICYLDKIFRQKDPDLIDSLNKIREQTIDNELIERFLGLNNIINKKVFKPTRIFSHNEKVDETNKNELSKIKKPSYAYSMYSEGRLQLIELLKRGCLAPEKLTLKEGAVVMFVKNNFEAGYVNGTLGHIIGFDKNKLPIVETFDGNRIYVEPQVWVLEEDKKNKAIIEQIPLRLAWAITIHKSQGMTLDGAQIDLSSSFEYGMGYVALSRVRDLKGLELLGFNKKALEVNPNVVKIDKDFRKKSKKIENKLKNLSRIDIQKKQSKWLEEMFYE